MGGAGPGRFARALARWRVWVIPGVLLLCVTLPHLGQGDWQRSDSGRYVAVGLQAWRGVTGGEPGALWTLMGEPGQPYFNKPPLVMWVAGGVAHVFGAGPWQARLPTVLAALGCVLATVGIARSLTGRAAAMATGIVLALTYEFFRRTREVSMDMWQLLFILLAVWVVVGAVGKARSSKLKAQRGQATEGRGDGLAEGDPPPGAPRQDGGGSGNGASGLQPPAPGLKPQSMLPAFALAGVPLGLALLTKPLVALVVPAILGVWMLVCGLGRRAGLVGVTALVAVLVAAPWHVSMVWMHGDEFVRQYFGAEVVARAAGELTAADEWSKPVWFYAGQVLRTYWPWLGVLALALLTWARGRPLARDVRGPVLAALWLGVWFVLLSIFEDRRDRYALVLWPFGAWICGMWLARVPWGASWGAPWAGLRQFNRKALHVLAPAAVVVAVVFSLLPVRVQRPVDPQWPALCAWVRANGVEELWQGGFGLDPGTRVYLELGWWPRTTRDRWGEFVAEPPEGALIVYHRRGGLLPGEGEVELFRSGDLSVTRLESGPWAPVDFPDPGRDGWWPAAGRSGR